MNAKYLITFILISFSLAAFPNSELCKDSLERNIEDLRYRVGKLSIYTGAAATAASFGAGIGGPALILTAPGIVLTTKLLILQRRISHYNRLLDLEKDASDGDMRLRPATRKYLASIIRKNRELTEESVLQKVNFLFESGEICSEEYRRGIIPSRKLRHKILN